MNQQNTRLLTSAALLILFAAITRIFPHYPNFTAIGAIAIFGGSTIKDKKLAFLLPLAALVLSDVCLQLFTTVQGFYGKEQFFVYAAFLLITFLATYMKKINVANVAFAAVWSGVLFYLISNFGVWMLGTFYPKTIGGLASCYWAGVPFYNGEFFGSFFLNAIVANLFYCAILFGSYVAVKQSSAKAIA